MSIGKDDCESTRASQSSQNDRTELFGIRKQGCGRKGISEHLQISAYLNYEIGQRPERL